MHTPHLAAPRLNAPTLLKPREQVVDEIYATSFISAPRSVDSHKRNDGSQNYGLPVLARGMCCQQKFSHMPHLTRTKNQDTPLNLNLAH
jgi:hypothetical protein